MNFIIGERLMLYGGDVEQESCRLNRAFFVSRLFLIALHSFLYGVSSYPDDFFATVVNVAFAVLYLGKHWYLFVLLYLERWSFMIFSIFIESDEAFLFIKSYSSLSGWRNAARFLLIGVFMRGTIVCLQCFFRRVNYKRLDNENLIGREEKELRKGKIILLVGRLLFLVLLHAPVNALYAHLRAWGDPNTEMAVYCYSAVLAVLYLGKHWYLFPLLFWFRGLNILVEYWALPLTLLKEAVSEVARCPFLYLKVLACGIGTRIVVVIPFFLVEIIKRAVSRN